MKIENNQLIVEVNGVEIVTDIESDACDRYINAWSVPSDYREEGLFLSYSTSKTPHEVPACKQSSVKFLGAMLVPASNEMAIANAKHLKIAEINAACDRQSRSIKSSYPEAEVLSWPQQVKEAESLLSSPSASAPLLTALADARGITVPDLAELVIAKANAFSVVMGEIIGKRQHLEQLVQSMDSIGDIEAVSW
jgi:hypothetical protein